MEKILTDWLDVIKNGDVTNTYKMAWASAIVECCVDDDPTEVVHFDRLAKKIFKYYWNQTIYFDLQQGSNPNKPPLLISYTKEKINQYRSEYGVQPEDFDKVDGKGRVQIDLGRITRVLKKDVCYRFCKAGRTEYPLYVLDKGNSTIQVNSPSVVKEYADFLFEVINYRWVQIVENWDSSPRVAKKIRGTDQGNIKRKSLKQFHIYLELTDDRCFLSGEEFASDPSDRSVDHVIPWSYFYSDDLWNLVFVKKGFNSSKSNSIVSETVIERLERRNERLLAIMTENGMSGGKQYSELKLAIEHNLLRKSWINCKG